MFTQTAKMSERGQIVIPQAIREKIGATQNTTFIVTMLDADTIALKRLDRTKLAEEFREMRASTIKMSDEEIEREIAAVRREREAEGLR